MRCFFLLLFILPFFLKGQGTDIELGLTGGTTIYVGDLSGSLSEYSAKDLGYTAGVFLEIILINILVIESDYPLAI